MRNILILWLLRLVSLLPLSIARIKGAWLGRLLTVIGAQPSRIARINLSLCYPHLSDDEIKQICDKRMSHSSTGCFGDAQGLAKRQSLGFQKSCGGKGSRPF